MEKQTTLIILLNKYVSQQYITLSPRTSMNVFSYGRVDQLPSEEEKLLNFTLGLWLRKQCENKCVN